ncbi:MAG: lytic transglycosylase domain-containing protein, partial [Acidobacteria bacterium]|nr:lytic transglycosylase domain-containing protein [Acidobacteriota bacterium]
MGFKLRVGRFWIAGCTCAMVFGGAIGGHLAAAATGLIARPSGQEWELTPTAHPKVAYEPSLLWLAPVGKGRPPANSALGRLASGIELYQRGRYLDALPLVLARSSFAKPAAHYAAYYAALAQLRLGRVDAARRQLAAVTAGQPIGYLSEAVTLAEAEAAETAGDYAGAQRVYERLLDRAPMAPDYVWFRLGKTSLAAGNRTRAIEAFHHVYKEFPLSQFTSDVTSELSGLQALEPLAPGNARYQWELKRAELLLEAKRYDEARAAFERLRVYATGAERDRLEVRRAVCDYFTRRYAAARAAMRAYREKGAHQAEARFFDLIAARALGRHAEFEGLAREFLNVFGGSLWAEETLNTLGTHYIQANRDDDADLVFRRLLTAFPAGRFAERAAWKVGWRAYRFGSKAEATEVFEAAATTFTRSDYRPAYVYWAARARESLGDYELAASRYALVRIDYLHSYYGRLAAAALEQHALPLRASFETTAVSSDDRTTAALPPSVEIIRLLLSTGLYDDALNELRYAQHAWGDSSMLQATLGWLHHQRGDLLLGANVTKRAYPQYLAAEGDALPSELVTVIFPMGYWSLIRQYAATHSLDPYLLAALVAQESGFIPDIRSAAKATGLMQLMAATAERYARKLAVSPYSPALLTRPETNVRLGTAYFADLVREFGDVHLALAGYNAGENRVRRWVAERPGLAPD